MTEWLSLKWGSLKGWDLQTDHSKEILRRYIETGVSLSAALQRDTPEQKQIICELIDAVDCKTIFLDWDGKDVPKEEAKKYVLEYERRKADATSA